MLPEVRHEKHVMHKCIPRELYYHIKGILKMEKFCISSSNLAWKRTDREGIWHDDYARACRVKKNNFVVPKLLVIMNFLSATEQYWSAT